MIDKETAATRIQACYRGYLGRKIVQEKHLNFENADQYPEKIMLLKRLAPYLAKQLARPTRSPLGYYVMHNTFKKKNLFLEQNAVRLCNIEPHHHVLEIGFGPGYGLAEALQLIEADRGCVVGVDWSDYCVKTVGRNLLPFVAMEMLVLFRCDAAKIPLLDNKFDRVFHTNCYYFWGNRIEETCRELHRVLKPNGYMVTCLNLKSLEEAMDMGLFPEANIDPVVYMTALERVGFRDVKMEYLNDKETNEEYQAIHAKVGSKRMAEDIEDEAKKEIEYQQDFLQSTL